MTTRYEESVINQVRAMWSPLVADLRFRLTVRRLMAIVSAAGLCLAAYRLHISLRSFLFGVLSLALLRTFGKLDRDGLQGRPSTAVGVFIQSMGIASGIVGVSCLTLGAIYPNVHGGGEVACLILFGLGLMLIRSIESILRLRNKGTLGDRQVLQGAIGHALRTPVFIGLVLLPLILDAYPVTTDARRSPLDSGAVLLSVMMTAPVVRRMRRWLW